MVIQNTEVEVVPNTSIKLEAEDTSRPACSCQNDMLLLFVSDYTFIELLMSNYSHRIFWEQLDLGPVV